MYRVFVCSPYGGKAVNVERAKRYGRALVDFGYCPIIPHVMLHGVLDDAIPTHRSAGMAAGKAMMKCCLALAVCGPELTEGMKEEIRYWLDNRIGGQLLWVDDAGRVGVMEVDSRDYGMNKGRELRRAGRIE